MSGSSIWFIYTSNIRILNILSFFLSPCSITPFLFCVCLEMGCKTGSHLIGQGKLEFVASCTLECWDWNHIAPPLAKLFVPSFFIPCLSTYPCHQVYDLNGSRVSVGLSHLNTKEAQIEQFSFSLLKQAIHEVILTVSLSKYKHSEGIHLALCLIILSLVMWKS